MIACSSLMRTTHWICPASCSSSGKPRSSVTIEISSRLRLLESTMEAEQTTKAYRSAKWFRTWWLGSRLRPRCEIAHWLDLTSILNWLMIHPKQTSFTHWTRKSRLIQTWSYQLALYYQKSSNKSRSTASQRMHTKSLGRRKLWRLRLSTTSLDRA